MTTTNPEYEQAVASILGAPEARITVLNVPQAQGQTTCVPHDMTWQWWWAPILGPTSTLTLSYLHHLHAQGHRYVDLREVMVAMGLRPGKMSRNNAGVNALARIASFRLGHIREVDEISEVLLLSPIPRPTDSNLRRVEERKREAVRG